jgi:dynein assembly factor 3
VFKYWRSKTEENFPARKCWDARLRAYFGTRYDSRSNAYDWDFSMKLHDRKHGSIVNNRAYAKWRETGIGFELRDVGYDKPNITLSSGMVFNNPLSGDKLARRGYFGDIVVGPFISYGIQASNEDFYKKQNDIYRFVN